MAILDMNRLLLIDDDIELTAMLSDFLTHEGYEVDIANDGLTGAKLALTGRYALAVLDVMMPKLNGIETLRLIRDSSHVPVIMLTAKGDEADRFFGLELGADDYVPKPCTPRELLARIRAILRRVKHAKETLDESEPISVGLLTIWPAQRRAEWQAQNIELTSTEYNLLEVLVRNAGHVVSKEDLSQQGLGRPLAKFDRSIDVHLSSIRQKIAVLAADYQCIQTVYRMGYQLVKT